MQNTFSRDNPPTHSAIAQALAASVPDLSASARTRHSAAVALVLYPLEGVLTTLLIRRAEDPRDPWSGQMALPGGWKDPEDPTLEQTARRECLEEVGLDLQDAALLGRLDDVETERLREIDLSVAAFVFYLKALPPLTPNVEVAEAVHVPLARFLDPAAFAPYRFPADPLDRDFPSIAHEGHIIWGLTYRVFRNLFLVLGHALPDEDARR